MLANQEFETPADALAHYGRKGMRWGHREEYADQGWEGNAGYAPPSRAKKYAKRAAIGAGVVGVIGTAAVVGGSVVATKKGIPQGAARAALRGGRAGGDAAVRNIINPRTFDAASSVGRGTKSATDAFLRTAISPKPIGALNSAQLATRDVGRGFIAKTGPNFARTVFVPAGTKGAKFVPTLGRYIKHY